MEPIRDIDIKKHRNAQKLQAKHKSSELKQVSIQNRDTISW